MPTSHYHQLNEIMEAVVLTNPASILDVGAGFGKFGVLAREYLEVRRGNRRPQDWRCRIDAIEGFQPYLSPIHHFVYNQIFTGEAQEIVSRLSAHYDLALLIDVLEHFEYQAGLDFIVELQKHTDNLLISTPKQFIIQGAVFGNQLETHLSHWKRKDFLPFGEVCFIPNDVSLICYIGQDKRLIESEIYTLRRRIRRNFRFVMGVYRLVKSLFDG